MRVVFRYYFRKIIVHGLVGVAVGLFILHPASRLVHLLLTAPGDFTPAVLMADLARLEHHFTMHVYFAILGAVAGLMHGLYTQRVFNLSNFLDNSSFMETASRTYRNLFGRDVPDDEDDAEVAPEPATRLWLDGTAVAPGTVTGEACLLRNDDAFMDLVRKGQAGAYTADDFETALADTETQLQELREHAVSSGAEDSALIFDAHLMVLRDPAFTGAVRGLLSRGESVSRAVLATTNRYVEGFTAAGTPYFQDKVHDLRDIVVRLMENLVGERRRTDYRGKVVVGGGILPSDMLRMAAGNVGGVVLLQGGVNSHTAIIARSLRVPAVLMPPERLPYSLTDGTAVLLDGNTGRVCFNPSSTDTAVRADVAGDVPAGAGPFRPVRTADGTDMALLANINILADLRAAGMRACGGVGLYRTEFSFINYGAVPAEEDQYRIYRQAVERAPGGRVVFRAFDLGGDKDFVVAGSGSTVNPLLGLKSTRFLLRNPDVFRGQVRAVLRACRDVPARILFPMVLSVDDFEDARRIVDDCVRALGREDVPHAREVLTGAMAESPAVLDVIDDLCRTADFISLGTNDLIQYLLAVDRSDVGLAEYYLPHHPAVLRALKRIADAAARHGTQVTVCGDMASEPAYLPFLAGIGLRAFSVEPSRAESVRDVLSGINLPDAEADAAAMLRTGTVRETEALLRYGAGAERQGGITPAPRRPTTPGAAASLR